MRRCHAMSLSLCLAGAAACSYIVELPSSYAPIPAVDAASDGPDAATPESDASPFDADVPFCESAATSSLFCADFDDAPAPELTTLGAVQTTSGSLEIVNAISRSAPRSLLSTVSGPDASSALVHPLGASPESLTAASSVLLSTWAGAGARLTRIELASEDAGAGTLCFVQLTAATTWLVTQVCSTGGLEVGSSAADSGRPIALREWHRLSLGLKLTVPKTVTLDIDDVRVVSVPALDAMQPSPTSVTFGIERSTGGAVALFQDDVLVTSP